MVIGLPWTQVVEKRYNRGFAGPHPGLKLLYLRLDLCLSKRFTRHRILIGRIAYSVFNWRFRGSFDCVRVRFLKSLVEVLNGHGRKDSWRRWVHAW